MVIDVEQNVDVYHKISFATTLSYIHAWFIVRHFMTNIDKHMMHKSHGTSRSNMHMKTAKSSSTRNQTWH